MNKLWISVVSVVFGIAAVKTVLMSHFFLKPEMINLATVSGLFALFSILTAGVGYFAMTRLKAYLEHKHFQRLAPGRGETASKEEIIRRYAREWGLSKAELDVAIFAAKGFSNTEIAEMRGSTVPTVKTQLGQIFKKTELENRYQLMAFVTDEVCVMAEREAGAQQAGKAAKSRAPSSVVPMIGTGTSAKKTHMNKQKLALG